jgi:hypothetical protein
MKSEKSLAENINNLPPKPEEMVGSPEWWRVNIKSKLKEISDSHEWWRLPMDVSLQIPGIFNTGYVEYKYPKDSITKYIEFSRGAECHYGWLL